MDIDKVLAALRAAFPRVGWTATEDEPGTFSIHGGAAYLWPTMGHWYCNNAVAANPVSAVRAWLAAQPTAAFYPEATSGETVEVRGFVVVNAAGEYHARGASWGTYESEWGARNAEETFGVNCEDALSRRSDAIPFIVHVPLPVDPPVLVGEVSDV